MNEGSVLISLELRADPDVMAHIAHITEAALAADATITEIRKAPTVMGELERGNMKAFAEAIKKDNSDETPAVGRRGRGSG